MTHAERTASTGERDDVNMIYEMYQFSQYSDGSVLNCITMKTFTAREIANVDVDVDVEVGRLFAVEYITRDLIRNAKAAIKNGSTTNLAPRV